MKDFGEFCIMLLFIVVMTFLGGFVFMKLYNWFIVPAYGLQPILFIQAIGISAFIGFVRYRYKESPDNKDAFDDSLSRFTHYVLYNLVALGLGWIVTLFM